MYEARMLGNYVMHLSEIKGLSISDLCRILNCDEHKVKALFKGRAFASFAQLSNLADALDTSVDRLLQGDASVYNRTVVHCMNDFQDGSNREYILDLIDDYVDVVDLLSTE